MSAHTFLLSLLITLALTAYLAMSALSTVQQLLQVQQQHVTDTFATLSE